MKEVYFNEGLYLSEKIIVDAMVEAVKAAIGVDGEKSLYVGTHESKVVGIIAEFAKSIDMMVDEPRFKKYFIQEYVKWRYSSLV